MDSRTYGLSIEEQKALIVLHAGGRVEESPQGYLTDKTHHVARVGHSPSVFTGYGETAVKALAECYDKAAVPMDLAPVPTEGMVMVPASFPETVRKAVEMMERIRFSDFKDDVGAGLAYTTFQQLRDAYAALSGTPQPPSTPKEVNT